VSGVRPASVAKIVALFVDRSSRNLDHSFPDKEQISLSNSEVVYAHARPLIDCHLQLSKFCTSD